MESIIKFKFKFILFKDINSNETKSKSHIIISLNKLHRLIIINI